MRTLCRFKDPLAYIHLEEAFKTYKSQYNPSFELKDICSVDDMYDAILYFFYEDNDEDKELKHFMDYVCEHLGTYYVEETI